MAAGGLSGRLGRLEAKVWGLVIARMARRRAENGVSAAELEAELQRFFRLVRARLGPWPDHRALAELLAAEYDVDAATAYRELTMAGATREKRRAG